MGCGSSSLKGEKVDVNDPPPQPLGKVKTNFSDVNFGGQNDTARRGKSIALAPDEHRRVTEIEEDEEPIPSLPKQGAGTTDGIIADTTQHHTTDGDKLEPYRSTGENKSLNVSNKTGFLSSKGNPIVGMSDEELMKKVGMSREEFEAWKNDPKNGVGQHQRADSAIANFSAFGGM